MHAEHALRAQAVEHAALDHAARPAAHLLGRLEQEHVAPGQLRLPRTQRVGHADQHGGVTVVPAGVHAAVDARAEGDRRLLLQRQGVDVRAQQHRAPGPPAGERQHRAGRRGAGQPLQAGSEEVVEERGGGAVLLEAQLRLGVQRAPQLDDALVPGAHRLRQRGEGHGYGVSALPPYIDSAMRKAAPSRRL